MNALKLIKLFFRLVIGVAKLLMKLMVVFTALALIFGIQASLVMTLILAVFIFLIFINNLFSVLTEGKSCHKKYEKTEPYDFLSDDYWIPGAPAVTQKAFIQGFFDRPKL